jgi:hypothetical protein
MSRYSLIYTVLLLTGVQEVWCQADIRGEVAGQDGTKIGSGIVNLRRLGDRTAGRPLRPYATSLKQDGSFVLSTPPAGRYALCVATPYRAWLDPCYKSPDRAPTIEIRDGKVTGDTIIRLERSVPLSVRITDAAGSLDAAEKSGRGILVGVAGSDLMLVPMREVARGAGWRDYQTMLPPASSAVLSISSPGLRVALEQGDAASQPSETLRIPLTTGKAENPLLVNVRVVPSQQ